MNKIIASLCKTNNEKFVLAYCTSPDDLLHTNGCNSDIVKNFIISIEKSLERLQEDLIGTNTLIIISADHGHNDIGEPYKMLDLNELNECLIMPPTFESRFLSFFVKSDYKKYLHNVSIACLAKNLYCIPKKNC